MFYKYAEENKSDTSASTSASTSTSTPKAENKSTTSKGLDAGDWGYGALGSVLGGGAGWLLGRMIHGNKYKRKGWLQLIYALSGAGIGGGTGLAFGKDMVNSMFGGEEDKANKLTKDQQIKVDAAVQDPTYQKMVSSPEFQNATKERQLDMITTFAKERGIYDASSITAMVGGGYLGARAGWKHGAGLGDWLYRARRGDTRAIIQAFNEDNPGLSRVKMKDWLGAPEDWRNAKERHYKQGLGKAHYLSAQDSLKAKYQFAGRAASSVAGGAAGAGIGKGLVWLAKKYLPMFETYRRYQ